MEKQEQTRPQRFVTAILEQCTRDKGFAARLRRADNPDTEHYAYGILCAFGISLECDEERQPFALIGAALSRSKREHDGFLGLGKALRDCVDSEEQGEARLRRVLSCRRQEEACRTLRPLLSLIQAKDVSLGYARLLEELLAFRFEESRRRICRRWAQEFYGKTAPADTPAEEENPCAS